MITTWLYQNRSKDLILFFNGWGMDENPFNHLKSADYDVLIISDYQKLNDKIFFSKIIERYNRVYLVAWSMGVWQASHLLHDLVDQFEKTVAINGSLQPVHSIYGIDPHWFEQTIENLGDQTLQKFFMRMCRDKENHDFFIRNKPKRSIDSIQNELKKLYKRASASRDIHSSFYSHAIISNKDFVIPTRNQSECWSSTTAKITKINGYHYIFRAYNDWTDLLVID